MFKTLKTLFSIAVLAGAGYFAYERYFPTPCVQPIKYSLGQIDASFGLQQADFLTDIQTAASIWDNSINKELFQYDPNGKLKINLVYDYRQQATDKLKDIGINIDSSQESYTALKSRYQTMKSDYELAKQALDAEIKDYQKRQAAYSAQVNYWNSRGGAPKGTYEDLQKQKAELDADRDKITRDQTILNQQVDTLNTVINALNQLAKDLNLNISQYNNVGTSRGSEFEEGVYVQDATGRHIDIFEFSNTAELVRLVAHELGHSLGMEHVDDPDAIMYKLNTSANIQPTAADLAELKLVCKLK